MYNKEFIAELLAGTAYKFYFCKKTKTNYLDINFILGSSLNMIENLSDLEKSVAKIKNMALKFCDATGFDINTISFTTILQSTHMKGHYLIWSEEPNQMPIPGSFETDSFWDFIK